jgi:hypothetical protein
MLPAELRLDIWEFALLGPRVINIVNHYASDATRRLMNHTFEGNVSRSEGFSLRTNRSAYTTDTEVLDALYGTCKDSHNIVKKYYGRYFAGLLVRRLPWINPSIDLLHFTGRLEAIEFFEAKEEANREDLQQLSNFKHLAMPIPLIGLRERPLFNDQWPDIMYEALAFCTPRTFTFVHKWDEARARRHFFI